MFVHEVLSKLMKYHRYDEIAAVIVDKKQIRAALERDFVTLGYDPKTITDEDVDAAFRKVISDLQIDAHRSLTIAIADYVSYQLNRQ